MTRTRGNGRMVRWVAVAAAAVLVLAACGDDGDDNGNGAPADADYDITMAIANEPLTFDPLLDQDFPGRVIYGSIYESLIVRSPDGQSFDPLLAASLPTEVDDTTWEVELNEDATFASGKALEPDDVVYTVERVLDPDFESEQAQLFQGIAGAEAVDEQTVHIITEGPNPVMLPQLSMLLIMPVDGADAEGFPETPESLDGTGPYHLVSHNPGVDTVVEKRDDYWRGGVESAPQQFTQRIVGEESTAISGLDTGEIDLVIRLDPDQAGTVPHLESITGTESVILRLNARSGTLEDQSLREAINVAVDRDSITNDLFSGYATASNCQMVAPAVFGHTGSLEVPPFEPERASELVAEAGAPTLSMTVPASAFPKFREVGQAVADQLEAVGFTVDLALSDDPDVLRPQLTEPDSFPNIFMYSSSNEFLDESQQMTWLTTTGVFSGGADETIDALADEALGTTDQDERQSIYDELNELACEDAANVYLYYPEELYGLSDQLEWSPRVDGLIYLTEMSER